MLSSLSTEDRIPPGHPIRKIRVVVDAVLAELDDAFDTMCTVGGRRSPPSETLSAGSGVDPTRSFGQHHVANESAGPANSPTRQAPRLRVPAAVPGTRPTGGRPTDERSRPGERRWLCREGMSSNDPDDGGPPCPRSPGHRGRDVKRRSRACSVSYGSHGGRDRRRHGCVRSLGRIAVIMRARRMVTCRPHRLGRTRGAPSCGAEAAVPRARWWRRSPPIIHPRARPRRPPG